MPPQRMIPVFQVDAFTSEPFHGNPAAVCLSEIFLDEHTKQKIAAEMNLSETAFVSPLGNMPYHEASRFLLQWFTPEVEVPLCGHATLATAAVLFYEMENSNDTLHFHTKSGELKAFSGDSGITLDLPAASCTEIPPPQEIIDALGIPEPEEVRYSEKAQTLLVILADEDAVRSVKPDFVRLGAIGGERDGRNGEGMSRDGMNGGGTNGDKMSREAMNSDGTHRGAKNGEGMSSDGTNGETMNGKGTIEKGFSIEGVIVTAPGSEGINFVSRFFGPRLGIDEDPVTGAAHTILGPYWADRLGEDYLVARQLSSRGGDLDVIVRRDGRVDLSGDAVVVMKGKLYF